MANPARAFLESSLRSRGGSGGSESRHELHDDLARLYFELAESYRMTGDRLRAALAERMAIYHSDLSVPPDPPRADSMVLAVGDAQYIRTDARGVVQPPQDVPPSA